MTRSASILGRLVAQFGGELSYWRLSPLQAALLVLLAAWPWLIQASFPPSSAVEGLSFFPVIVFIPIGYLVGGTQMWWPGGYQVGFSVAVFLQAYICVACWRIRRAYKNKKIRA